MKGKILLYVITAIILISSVTALTIGEGTIFHPSGTEAYYNITQDKDLGNLGEVVITSTNVTIYYEDYSSDVFFTTNETNGTFTNSTYFYDDNRDTYTQWEADADSQVNEITLMGINIGNKMVHDVYVKLRVQTEIGVWRNMNVSLESYNGTAWNMEESLLSLSGGGDADYNYSGTITLDKKVMGLRINFTTDSNQLGQDLHKLYELEYNIPLELINDPDQETYYQIGELQELNIRFMKDEVTQEMQGRIITEDMNSSSYYFEGTGIFLDDYNLDTTLVRIEIGENISSGNCTQFYEFENDEDTSINREIEILDDHLLTAYYKVMDQSGNSMNGVVIQAYTADLGEMYNWQDFKLIGRRITNQQGRTMFYHDLTDGILLVISKDGYNPKTKVMTGLDLLTTDYNSPTEIILEPSISGQAMDAWAFVPKYYSNLTENLTMVVVARDYSNVKYNTSYKGEMQEVTSLCDSLMHCPITMQNGDEFSNVADSFNVNIYLDNELWRTYTISQETKEPLYYDEILNLSSGTRKIVMGIFIFLLGLVFTIVFKTTKAGLIGAALGLIFAAVFDTAYTVVLVAVGIIIVGRFIYKMLQG